LADAIAAWAGATEPAGVITVLDSATYAESLLIALAAGRSLVIQAADGQRPLLRLQTAGGAPAALIVTGATGTHGAHAQRAVDRGRRQRADGQPGVAARAALHADPWLAHRRNGRGAAACPAEHPGDRAES
jgi:hypothetical protein